MSNLLRNGIIASFFSLAPIHATSNLFQTDGNNFCTPNFSDINFNFNFFGSDLGNDKHLTNTSDDNNNNLINTGTSKENSETKEEQVEEKAKNAVKWLFYSQIQNPTQKNDKQVENSKAESVKKSTSLEYQNNLKSLSTPHKHFDLIFGKARNSRFFSSVADTNKTLSFQNCANGYSDVTNKNIILNSNTAQNKYYYDLDKKTKRQIDGMMEEYRSNLSQLIQKSSAYHYSVRDEFSTLLSNVSKKLSDILTSSDANFKRIFGQKMTEYFLDQMLETSYTIPEAVNDVKHGVVIDLGTTWNDFVEVYKEKRDEFIKEYPKIQPTQSKQLCLANIFRTYVFPKCMSTEYFVSITSARWRTYIAHNKQHRAQHKKHIRDWMYLFIIRENLGNCQSFEEFADTSSYRFFSYITTLLRNNSYEYNYEWYDFLSVMHRHKTVHNIKNWAKDVLKQIRNIFNTANCMLEQYNLRIECDKKKGYDINNNSHTANLVEILSNYNLSDEKRLIKLFFNFYVKVYICKDLYIETLESSLTPDEFAVCNMYHNDNSHNLKKNVRQSDNTK